MDTPARPPPTLTTLPPELALRLLLLLDAQSIVRLSLTCTTLHTLARTDSIWRNHVTNLVTRHGAFTTLTSSRSAPPRSSWFTTAAFLLPLSHHLGYFASSKQFSSRLIRVAIHSSSPSLVPSSPDTPPPHYTLHASHLRVRNFHDSPLHPIPPAALPLGATLDPLARSAYSISPNLNPAHPYAGLSVDVLEPCYSFDAAMFDVSPEEGAVLCRAEERSNNAGTEKREGVLAAAAAAGVFGGGAPPAFPPPSNPPPPSHSPFRLRLALEKVEQRVEPDSASSDDPEDDEADSSVERESQPGQGGTGRRRNPRATAREQERLYALFSGRLPRTPWPTMGLVGLEEVPYADLYDPASSSSPASPSSGTVLRATHNGAFRGLCEALTLPLPSAGAGEGGGGAQELPLARVEGPPNPRSGREKAYVSGFRLRAKRRTEPVPPVSSYFGSTSDSAGSSTPATATGAEPSTSTAVRRRAEGAYAGMRVLWNGSDEREHPEDERPAVTILRAGDEAEGGLVLRLPGSPPSPPDPAPLPTTADSPPTPITPSASPDSALADAINHSEEAFFPIRPPSRPLSFADAQRLDTRREEGDGEVKASELEGMWVGTYGAHGLEFVHLAVGFAEVTVLPSQPLSGEERLGSPNTSYEAQSGRTSWRRIVTATKLTGDANVPSGQVTWLAVLPASSSLSALDTASPSSPLGAEAAAAALNDGPLPTIAKAKFEHLGALDPLSPPYLALNNGAGPDWSEGTAQGWGRIALPGFTSPSWTGMEVRFFRSEVSVERDGAGEDGEKETRTIESVEEIHICWPELHKVGVLRRVRI